MINEWALRALVSWQALRRKLGDDDGQTLAEYGLMVSFVVVAVIALAVVGFRGSLTTMFNNAAECIDRVTC